MALESLPGNEEVLIAPLVNIKDSRVGNWPPAARGHSATMGAQR